LALEYFIARQRQLTLAGRNTNYTVQYIGVFKKNIGFRVKEFYYLLGWTRNIAKKLISYFMKFSFYIAKFRKIL
jgi:hypothetical protein